MVKPVYKTETFDLPNSFCALIGKVRQKLVDNADKELAPSELTFAQVIVLLKLSNGSARTPGDFCRSLDYDPGSMTRLLDRIENKGFIKRVRSAEDRRSVELELTEKGKELCPQLIPIMVDLNNRLLSGFSSSEVRTLEELLKRVLVSD